MSNLDKTCLAPSNITWPVEWRSGMGGADNDFCVAPGKTKDT